MSEFFTLWRYLLVVAFFSLQIDFRLTLFGDSSIRSMQVFMARNELVLAVQRAGREADARGIRNLCHFIDIFVVKSLFQEIKAE